MRTFALYGVTLGTRFTFSWPLQAATGPSNVVFTCRSGPPRHVDWSTVPTLHATPADVAGSVGITFHQVDDADVIRFHGSSDFYLHSDRIVCHLHDPALEWLVEIQLLGMVLALWLERRGTPTLHASSSVIDGKAVAFLGMKGGGKTTAATAMLAAGHPLLVDDLLAIQLTDGAALAQSGFPLLRLWPDQADHFVGQHETLPRVHPGFAKRRVLVGRQLGSFHASAVPLRRIYLPERTDDRVVTIEKVTPRDAAMTLLRNSFLPETVVGFGLAAEKIKVVADLLQHVDVRHLRYPNGFGNLPEMVEAVEMDVGAGTEP